MPITAVDKEKLVASAQRYLKRGQVKKAIAEVERLVVDDKEDMRARLELADLYERGGEPKRAVEVYTSAATDYEANNFGLKALAVYLRVVQLDPKNRHAHAALGRLYAEQGLYQEAAGRFQTALDCATGVDAARARLEVTQEILKLDQENLGDRLRLAEGYSAIGLREEAVAELRAVAVALDERAAETDFQVVAERLLYHKPDELEIARTLAASYIAQEEPQRALAKLKTAFEAKPRDLEILGLLAEAFNQLGQVHKSVTVLKEMARHYDESGLIHERDECYARILMLDPNDMSARDALGQTGTEAAGQTLEFVPESSRARPATSRKRRPSPAQAEEFDDFDFDFDDEDEIGFGGGAENTIVDDAFIPEDVREHLEESALSLAMPGAAVGPPPSALQEDLRELDFYINNGLVGEAAGLLNELFNRHGRHPLLERREQQLAGMR
ncbi:MAG: tetratricopeptide repeat protein [Deltaproteobacteria bacterium]|nr:MAG: tetratricopeptide repeat protein [Deltaproteobacteria bacterium]